MRRVGIIILAAGESSRLGYPKQLLPWEGRSLILRATQAALASICRPVIVVLGAYADVIAHEIRHLHVTRVFNQNWKAGMGASIVAGMKALSAFNRDGALLMVSDQPFVTSTNLNQIEEIFSQHGGIVASAYKDTLGVPAVFDREYHQELIALSSAQGAKYIIQRHPQSVRAFDFPQGAIDIDKPADQRVLGNCSPATRLPPTPGLRVTNPG